MKTTKIEFAVQLNGSNADEEIKSALKDVGTVEINKNLGSVIIETSSTPWSEIQSKIEATGRRAVLTGFGGQSCVSIIDTGKSSLKGVVRICNVSESSGSVIDGVVDGLQANRKYRFNIHECGDLSEGCQSVGGVFKPSQIEEKIVEADANGRLSFRILDKNLNVPDLIGRSVVISEKDSDERLGCGIIARSAGIFQNSKKICACDGVTIWSERDRPIAGKGRRDEK
ncbi:copper chaperone for superoxide dismutase [Culicoides brevitarsis]|uniref:copper chaperone for superoxide dismutase n=1 Tax=Culicoides brevitarsis TaxID=469753 RepID=UPI00307C9136